MSVQYAFLHYCAFSIKGVKSIFPSEIITTNQIRRNLKGVVNKTKIDLRPQF